MPQVSANDVKLYFTESGNGTPIVFIHEFAGDYRSWEPQVRYFSRRYRCIAYNARGYPPSQTPAEAEQFSQQHAVDDLFGVMNGLELVNAHLVGLSMGSFTALHFALQHPDRVRSLVLAGTGHGALDPQKFSDDIQTLANHIEQLGIASVASEYAVSPSRLPFKRKDPRGWQEFSTQLAHHSSEGSVLTLRGVQARRAGFAEYAAQLRELSLPALVIAGDEDSASLEASLFLKRTIPSCGLAVLPKSGHTLNLEEPLLFNSLIQEFYSTVEANRWESTSAVSAAAG